MKVSGISRYVLCASMSIALLAGCGGSQPPIGALGAMPQPAAAASQSEEMRHRLRRAHVASSSYGDLLYVAPDYDGAVTYYTYPAGELVGALNAGAFGLCSDPSGNIFVVDRDSITEFAHGGTSPINTFSGYGFNYNSCSVDPTTGDLAVAFLGLGGYSPGIAIFKDGSGRQFTYTDADFEGLEYCGYDGSGNLFADGFMSGRVEFAELPAGGRKLKNVALSIKIKKPGQVQWDGKYMTVADEKVGTIFRLKIKGSLATRVGTTKLHGFGSALFASWIYDGAIIVPFGKDGVGYVGFWKYPQGGSPTKTFAGPGYHTTDNAVAISPAN